ncbi:MAG: hypothetical protein COA79_09540 [Planctomycetota bacterium]|nr:MAG: hypothetical protein COA79_09540 [Planctomycetota bacterium]
MIKNSNDGSSSTPYLSTDLNMRTLDSLPGFSVGPKMGSDETSLYEIIQQVGYMGVQGGNQEICKRLGLKTSGGGRVNKPNEADEIARVSKEEGNTCATLHVGWGMESDHEVDQLLDAILNASEKHDHPLYIETHRATITQDIWRTVEMVKRFPEMRFNGDFSHWYTGLEMPYGNIEEKFDFLNPVFERVRFIHGRIGNPGCIQVGIGQDNQSTYVLHFKEMWTRSMLGFLKSAKKGDFFSFNPEILKAEIYYARTIPDLNGHLVEESDRWQEALIYTDIAIGCWKEAEKRMAKE